MFNVITGPFHPTLESTLVQEIQQLKSSDSLASIAIVVPSETLRHRVQWLLCVEHQCSLFDVHFLTFYQLARRLQHEQALCNQEKEVVRFELVHDLCFEHLLNSLAKKYARSFGGLTISGVTTGTGKALWRTIRDLKEAMVDPKIALQGVQEGLFEEDERQKLQNLFTVYAMVQEASRTMNIGSADDLASLMIPWVGQSKFLSRIHRVCYYGFYDLTQVQLSLFEAIAAKSRVTVYFPLSDGPAFSFARRFFERHFCSGGQPERDQEDRASDLTTPTGNGGSQQVTVIHTVGPEDELSVVCKEIMKLVETHQYSYDDIGIVVRNFEPYQSSLRRTFEQHRIPFTSSATVPVTQEPLIKNLIQLSSLPLTDFFWRDVLDILTSPWYRLDRFGVTREDIQPELWHQAVRTRGIHRGQDHWSQLTSLMQVGANQEMGQELPKGENDGAGIDPTPIQLLDRIITELIGDCRALPTQGTIGDLTQAFLSLAKTHLALPGLSESRCESLYEIPNQTVLVEAIQQALAVLQDMHVVKEIVTWEQWAQLFDRALNACTIAMEPDLHAGVRVLDAMSARGLPFRALFLMGLNEKVFPRFIREDAFLRDRPRRVLEETFGYKIDEKLAGYDEEQLLFSLLAQAARHRFYLVYQRADKEGRPLAPSPFLTEYQSPIHESIPHPEIVVPRRLSDRFRHPVFGSNFLTKEELGLKLIFQGYHPGGLLEKAGREPQLFQNGWESLQEIERQDRRLGNYDGMIHSSDTYWQECVRKGVTPTSLEVYARCPFQYFATRVLRVNSVRAKMLEELPASSLGDLCHAVLHRSYRQLMVEGWPERETPLQKVIMIAEEVLSRYAANNATGYFLTWQLTKDIIIQLVTSAVEADLQAYRQYGFRPMAFEVNAEGQFTTLGSPFANIKVRGRLDRIDFRDDPPSLRIVDYKFQAGSRMRSRERDLLLSGIRGSHLQPPLYALMNTFHDQQLNFETDGQGLQPEGVDFVYLAPRWEAKIVRSEFDAASWKGASGRQLKNTIQKLLEGVQSGRYFILPGEYCRHCEVSTACRRNHRPTWVRSHGASQARQLRQLRTQDEHGD
jgi:ATP-dependent helicase/nuclease subunit B